MNVKQLRLHYGDLRAALVFEPSGLMYCGANHGEAAIAAEDDGLDFEEQTRCWEGFHCEKLGFLTRSEAGEVLGFQESMTLGACLGLDPRQCGWSDETPIGYDESCERGFELIQPLGRWGI